MGKITNKQIFIAVMLVGIVASEEMFMSFTLLAIQIAVLVFADND